MRLGLLIKYAEVKMMEMTMLGTGNALVTECYNTCFVLSEGKEYFMIDGGGGNAILKQLKDAGINWKDIRNIFVTHKHVDHLMGIIWMIRMICQNMNKNRYESEVNLYAHKELIEIIYNISRTLLQEKETKVIGERLHLIPVEDGQECIIIGHKVVFFDIHSTKAKQYGFTFYLTDEERLTCCGDEPYNEAEKEYVQNSKWLLHEAFCLYSEADIFKPYEKHHSTVREACQLAEELGVESLLLYHTEDKNIVKRKVLYRSEGEKYFKGNLLVPDDLEVIKL